MEVIQAAEKIIGSELMEKVQTKCMVSLSKLTKTRYKIELET
jgi:hypothetical protein